MPIAFSCNTGRKVETHVCTPCHQIQTIVYPTGQTRSTPSLALPGSVPAATLLDEVYAFNAPPGVAEGHAARRSACFSKPPATDCGPDSEAVAEGRAAGRGVCFSAPLAADFGPGPEAVAILANGLAVVRGRGG